MAISLHHSLLPSYRHLWLAHQRLGHHWRLTQSLDGHTRLCGNISNSALNEVRSEVHSASPFAIVSDLDPLLPAARQTHPLNREFDMANYGLAIALIVSDFNSCHLCTVFDLDVKKVCLVPSWISASAPAQR